MQTEQSERSTQPGASTADRAANAVGQAAPDLADPRQKDKAGRAALKDMMKPVAGHLMLARALSALSAVLAIFPYVSLVWLGGLLLDAWTQGRAPDAQAVGLAVNVLIGTFIGRLVLYFVALTVTHFADMRLGGLLRGRIIDTLGRAPLAWFTSATSGRIRKAVQDDTHTLHALIAHAPVETTSAIVMPIAMFVYALIVDWRLGLLTIAIFPLYLALQLLGYRGMGTKTAEMDTKLAKVSATMVEFVSGITVVKAFGRVGRAHRNYAEAADEFSKFYLDWVRPMLKTSALSMAVVSPAVLLLVNLGCGAAMVAAGWVTPVQVLTTTLIALVLPASITTIGTSQWSYQLAGAAALRIEEVLHVDALVESTTPQHPQGHAVRFEHVSYGYGDLLAVDDVTLDLAEGSTTALIGPSGSGKSTLATLVARFDDPLSGTVTIGGADVRHIPRTELYRTVAFVLQDPQLLRMSVRDNIALARPDASLERVRTAARDAQIDDFVMTLPNGYDTVIGDDTVLSGGQQQRIAIARALITDAPVLLLDEATAFTDPESEAEIQKALNRLVRGRTVLVIAHRPASVAGADRIVVLDRGRVLAQGTHEELVDEPHYAALRRATGEHMAELGRTATAGSVAQEQEGRA
ncbi:ABC transporter ATP-binding protein [Pseudoclavibacter sp. CFCC 13796]|uniref:ABC transporter ATP-binding protein n=1 Tax=Pseudoclavibacter sp. CFCC 13796 TaxID=2615179 RepID=UPI00130191AB|nr:ABC transporter ATP-binding protein [Pseudoclavibacter sp. CFCC 13796]KAB1660444.1 ABC transporter ATP-binding protein [Pseudoclavibacter sp. CFCC 13796]